MPPPPDAFPPGTRLTVGSHRVVTTRYLSLGGFAHVYTCQIEPPFRNSASACLKRVVVPNKTQLTLLRQEVDAMKRLRGNSAIVSYIDSHAARMPPPAAGAPQQYEVLLLMEYCAGNGLIDFMNTRLAQRLAEHEVLAIASQVAAGVAMCHHLRPPLLHRDIKIENVLLAAPGRYKLCDFGSAVGYQAVPKLADELQRMHRDIMHHTTPQYRAPEMVDLSRGFAIDDKLDVWALGVLIYKVCYYTTPFELPAQQSLADLERLILHSATTLHFPPAPVYSQRLQNVIRCCLREDPRRRPSAVQLLQELCLMQGVAVPDVVPYSVRVDGDKRDEPPEALARGPDVSDRARRRDSLEKPLGIPRPEPARKGPERARTDDAFASIDKSKMLELKPKAGAPAAAKPRLRPKSAVFSSQGHPLYPSTSSASLHTLISQQVHDTSADLSSIRKSEELDRGTLEFLRSKDTPARNDTGSSLKASLKSGLRRISTGGSVKSQRSGSANYRRTSGPQQTEEPREDLKRKLSIQRRMAQLFSSRDKKTPKTASGYGKYTDQDDITAINYTDLSNNTSAESLVEAEIPAHFNFDKTPVSHTPEPRAPRTEKEERQKNEIPLSRSKSERKPEVEERPAKEVKPTPASELPRKYGALQAPPPCPPSLSHAKKKPPKPVKPQHLKLAERRLSTSSEISLPDLDDLEKQFARRFPSYV